MFLLLFVSVLGTSSAQHYCCMPAQWEANLGQLEGYYNPRDHHAGLIQGLDVVSYDHLNQRMTTKVFLQVDGRPRPPMTIHNDYKNAKQYVVTNTTCTSAPLTVPMPGNCIPLATVDRKTAQPGTKMFLLLLVSVLGSSSAQHYCCMPAQWEANLGQLEGYYNPRDHHAGLIQGLDVVSYDHLNQRMTTKVFLQVDGRPRPPMTIHNDYKNAKQYVVTNTTCTSAPLTAPMPGNCIPPSANFSGSTYFGVGRDKLMLDAFRFNLPKGHLMLTVTQNGCYPVTEGIVGEIANGGSIFNCKEDECVDAILAFGITALTTGIKDQSVFHIPDTCTNPQSHEPISGYSVAHHVHEVRRRYSEV